MKKYLCFLLCLMAVVACQQDVDFVPVEDVAHEEVPTNPYAISIEKALANLEDFMVTLDETRAEGVRVVSDITPIKYVPTTRSGENIDCENILFVANFENNQGYAILSGDERIEQPILAVTDTGNMDANTVNLVVQNSYEEDRVYVDIYPMTGPGYFTIPELAGTSEFLINPNTIDLFDITENDTLVGDYDFEADKRMGATIIYPSGDECPSDDLSIQLCASYAKDQLLNGNDYNKPSIIDGDPVDAPDPTPTPPVSYTTDTGWFTDKEVVQLMRSTAYWGQYAPFNKYCPLKYSIEDKKRINAPTGCFPLSIAKLMIYHRFPNTYNNRNIDWVVINYSASESAKDERASLLKTIGVECGSWYFAQGTFTFPKKAISHLEEIGFSNVARQDYDFETVVNMLDNKCPVIIYGVHNINLKRSHSWNIDGYRIRKREITEKVYIDDVLIRETTTVYKSEMVHCDFGWYGKTNGYYVTGVFDIKDKNVELDDGVERSENEHNFNTGVHIITYSRPNN